MKPYFSGVGIGNIEISSEMEGLISLNSASD